MSLCLYCPNCRTPELAITHVLRFRSTGLDRQRWVQALCCGACGFAAAACCDESAGSSGRERHGHVAARISSDTFKRLTGALASCPLPRSAGCNCNVHQWFRDHADDDPDSIGSVPTIGAPFTPTWNAPTASGSGAPTADSSRQCA